MGETWANEDRKRGVRKGGLPSGRTILAAVGFGCFLALQTYYGLCYALPLAESYSFGVSIALRIASVLALVSVLFICLGQANWILDNLHRLLLPAMAIGCVPFAYEIAHLTVGIPLSPAFIMILSGVAWMCLGVSFLFLGLAWCYILSQNTLRQSLGIIAASAGESVLLYSMTSAVHPAAFSLLGSMAILVCGYVLAIVLCRSEPCCGETHERESCASCLMPQEALWHTAYNAIYAFMLLASAREGLLAVILVGSCGIFGACLAFLTDKSHLPFVDSRLVYQVTLPATVVLFLLLPYCESWGIVLCTGATVAVNSFATLLYWCESTSRNAEFGLHPIRRFAQYSHPKWAGMLIGSVAGYLVFSAGVLSERGLAVASIVAVGVLLVCFMAFSVSEARREETLSTSLEEGVSLAVSGAESIEDACARVAGEGGLSPRETEVLQLLAKGRNARFIQENLFISLSTARSHIYHIYQKLGVSSQQELIDLVEKR